MGILKPVLGSVLRGVLPGLVAGGILPLSFPAAGATYDIDWTAGQYFGGVQSEGNIYSGTGDFFKQQISLNNPNYSENADGSLKKFALTQAVRRTTRGAVLNYDHTNILVSPRDLTNAAWVASDVSITVAKTQTGRDGVANQASLVTFGVDGTILQTVTGASSLARRMYADIKQITGSDPLEMTMDGSSFTTITLDAPRFNGIGRYSLPAGAAATDYVAGFRGVAGNSYLIDFVNVDESEYEMDPVVSNVRAWRDRASAQIASESPLAYFARDETTQVYFFEWAQRRDGGLAVSDGDLQLHAGSTGCTSDGAITANVPVFSDDRLLNLNRAIFWRSPTESGIILNGGDPAYGTPYTPTGALTHWDLGTNGAASQRLDGRITRLIAFTEVPSIPQMQAWTA